MIGIMNNRIFSVLCAISFWIFPFPSALAQEATSSASCSGSTLVEAKAKLNSQILEARKLGIGTKQLEDGISEADADLNSGKPEKDLVKRLEALHDGMRRHMEEVVLLKAGVKNGFVSAADRENWGAETIFMAKFETAVKKLWMPPKLEGNRRVVVRFDILRNGTITKLSVTQSSGVPALDQSALTAVRKLSPVNPAPQTALREGSVALEYTFQYNKPNDSK